MIPRNVLKAFGFRKCKKSELYETLGRFSKASFYNPFLDIYYDPKIHKDKQFALNVVSAMALRYKDALTVPNDFVNKVVEQE